MRILIVHNEYQIRGGEDSVVESEFKLLSDDHEVEVLYLNNHSVAGFVDKVKAAIGAIFSLSSYSLIQAQIDSYRPDVVHVHNYFPLISPSVFYACKSRRVPVVHTLHNYRSICPTSLLMLDGKPCERSLHSSVFWAVKRKVYKESYFGTLTLALLIEFHKAIGTWTKKVDRFIPLTYFSKDKFVTAGFPEQKLAVKPNFCENQPVLAADERGDYACFIGRLSEEKGIAVLCEGWFPLDYEIRIIGDGDVPRLPVSPSMKFTGRLDRDEALKTLRCARFIVIPSICYEGFPMAIAEAFACGTPVLCSQLGSMAEIVENEITGLHFEPGNAEDLSAKAQWLIDHPEECEQMGRNAKAEYLEKYTPEKNYEMLMGIYQQAIEEAKRSK
ncbi:glycosyltransferase family 4 protein [Bacterioplanoides sp.]|uniref:glycosyltransferase family 4 protein n=1 Tax=Bacterioplanoides sp. TaxID=2066072 RepID=UPI003B5C16D3